MDKKRKLYLVAYDICEPSRLQRVCRYLKGYKVGGQKSVSEIWATDAELRDIRSNLEDLMVAAVDRLHILVLDPRMQPLLYGNAHHFKDKFFSIV